MLLLPCRTLLLPDTGSRHASAPAASVAAIAYCFGYSQTPWNNLREKTKDDQGQDRNDLNSGRLRLWFGNIYGNLLSALAAVQQQSGSPCTGQRPRQEEAAIRTGKPSLICFHFTIHISFLQLFLSSFLKSFQLINTTPSQNLYIILLFLGAWP